KDGSITSLMSTVPSGLAGLGSNCSDITVRDLSIVAKNAVMASGPTSYGMVLLGCSNIHIIGCTIQAGNGFIGSPGNPGVLGASGNSGLLGGSSQIDDTAPSCGGANGPSIGGVFGMSKDCGGGVSSGRGGQGGNGGTCGGSN